MSRPRGVIAFGRTACAAILIAAAAAAGIAVPRAEAATPPPTPVPPSGSPSPFPTHLNTGPTTAKPPKIRAEAAILANLDTGQVLFADHPDQRRPVASLTKVMTALLTLEEADLHDVVTVSAAAAPPANLAGISALGLREGEEIEVEELLYALLLQSANDAAIALAEHVSGGPGAFERAMNRRAEQLGARNTAFASPNGLDDDGYSTARDLVAITRAAFEEPTFRDITRTRFHVVPGPPGGKPRRIQNRNVLLWLYDGAIGGKTGFTSRAGYCFIAVAERNGRSLIAVVLDEPAEPFSDAASLLDWGFEEFKESTPVREGDSLGFRVVNGTVVMVAADRTLDVLVPRKDGSRPRVIVTTSAPGTSPPRVGQRIGTVAVRGGARELATVPLVVTGLPVSPPAIVAVWAAGISRPLDDLAVTLRSMVGG